MSASASAKPITTEMVQAKLRELDEKQAGTWTGLVVLAVTIAAFVGLGIVQWDVTFIVLIVIVIFIHETGHFLGMKLFGYRDVRMFFIPMLGAAVSGRQRHASAAKQTIVALLGPVPGLFIGAALAIAYAVTAEPVLLMSAKAFVLVNALNLLPFYPLDGARILEYTVFSRGARVEIAFRLITGLCLLGLAVLAGEYIIVAFAVLILVFLPHAYRDASVAQSLRAEIPVEQRNADEVDDAFVDPILAGLYRGQMPKSQPPEMVKNVAVRCRNVWERVCTRPPSILHTIALLGAYGASFVLSLVFFVLVATVDLMHEEDFPYGVELVEPGMDEELENFSDPVDASSEK